MVVNAKVLDTMHIGTFLGLHFFHVQTRLCKDLSHHHGKCVVSNHVSKPWAIEGVHQVESRVEGEAAS